MRKIIFFIISICISGVCLADLGSIQVNSYLSQKLNATIPITKLPSDANYENLSIGLAGYDKFKSAGLTFNPELGYLLFKIIHSGNSAYLRITSSKPINSPVLSFLLHYQLDNDDFYRQYTILLDPIENLTPIPVAGQKTTPIIVYQNSERPIPVVRKVIKTKSLANNTAKTPSVSFEADYSSPFVKSHLANLDKDRFSYTTNKGDTLYVVARLIQLIYPKANLSLNQIIIGLGLENYNDLSKPDYAYPAGVDILLANPEAIAKIVSSDADAYLWDVSLNDGARTILLQKIATQFDDELEITSSILFAGTYEKLTQPPVASAPKMQPVASLPVGNKLWLDLILEYKYAVAAICLGLLIISLLLRRLRANKDEYILALNEQPKVAGFFSRLFHRNNSAINEAGNVAESAVDIGDDIIITRVTPNSELPKEKQEELQNSLSHESNKLFATSIPNSPTEAPVVTDNLITAPSSEVDHELVKTLEQILSFDDSREDIRYKLLELYLAANNLTKAKQAYNVLMTKLDEEDPLRKNIATLCSRYDFAVTPPVLTDSEASHVPTLPDLAAVATSSSSARNMEFKPIEIPVVTDEPSESWKVEKPEPVVFEFTSMKPITPIIAENETSLIHGEDARHTLDFNSPLSSEIAAPTADELVGDPPETDADLLADNLDEKINLARMYYHIDEHDKAYELLMDIVNAMDSKPEAKEYAKRLISDLGLHG